MRRKPKRLSRKLCQDENDDVLGTSVQENYKSLLNEIDKSKIIALDRYQNEIKKKLEDEIIKRYFYREGLFEYYLTHDEAILAAKELLANDAKYTSVLK